MQGYISADLEQCRATLTSTTVRLWLMEPLLMSCFSLPGLRMQPILNERRIGREKRKEEDEDEDEKIVEKKVQNKMREYIPGEVKYWWQN